MRRLLRPVVVAGTAAVLGFVLLGGASALPNLVPALGRSPERAAAPQTVTQIDPAAMRGARAGNLIGSLQARLRTNPRDFRGWSTLALAYVEQGRITADPTYYPKADRAIARAARLKPGDSVLLTARATLAAARHLFSEALTMSSRALRANPYSAAAAAIRSDALTELGRYRAARQAALRADDISPGPSTFARLSYQAELRGNLPEATRLMRLSQRAAGTSAPSYAYAAFHLGELARQAGRPARAAHYYRDALNADSTYMPALAGMARLAVARGDLATAERAYRTVVTRLPLPEYVDDLGELYEATGRQELAEQQYEVATAYAKVLVANGVATDLEIALFQADHGSPAAALVAAKAEWDRRRSVHTADALGWALHANGQDRAALRYARFANRLGTRDSKFRYHLGAIQAALGLPAAAATLRDAQALDAGVSPYREQRIATLLRGLR